MIIFVTICLINPALSIAQNVATQNDSIANSIILEAKAPSKGKWDYQPSNSIFNGDNLDIVLSWTPVQTSDPKAGANPVETVQMCTKWKDTTSRASRDNLLLTGPLKLVQTNETVQGSQFKINLDGHFPLGIRKPIEIHVTSSKPELIPSLAQTIYLSHNVGYVL